MRGVISIGSHWGQEYEEWKAKGAVNFMFFEPIKDSYRILCEKIPKDKSVLTFNMAIGNRPQKINMFVEKSNQGQSCSILEPKQCLEQFPDIIYDSKEEVSMDRLDNINYDRNLYDYMHIDVEGYELEVLKGATQSLRHVNEINIEVCNVERYLGCAMITDIDTFLKVNEFYRINVNWFAVTFGNAIYKRENIMTAAEKKYVELCATPSDTNEHLPTLQNYASMCSHVTELGVRKGVTTWAFLASNTKRLVSVDINSPEEYGGSLAEMRKAAIETGMEFKFILANDLDVELEKTELLFIDTLHTYRQLKAELALHSGSVSKFIILHDTETFALVGADGGTGLFNAVHEFLQANTEWKVDKIFKNNNGLTILRKK